MSRQRFFVCVVSLALVACIACGSGSRQIQSLSVSPSSADAQNYPDGRVPFVATGYYNVAPMTVTPLPANWGAASEQVVNGVPVENPTTDVSVDTNGVAQCNTGATGTYAIGAWVPAPTEAECNVIGGPFNFTTCPVIFNTAQLTCP